MTAPLYCFTSEQLNGLLCLTTEPILIWSVSERAVLKRNASAVRFAEVFQGLSESESLDLDRALPDWRKISVPTAHSLWMDFTDAVGKKHLIQVRSICLNPESSLWASLLSDAADDAEPSVNWADTFFSEFEKLWSRFVSQKSVDEKETLIMDMERLVSRALKLTDFGFYPGGVFEGFPDAEKLRRSPLWCENRHQIIDQIEKIKLLPLDCISSLEDFPSDVRFYLVPMDGKTLGFFYCEGMTDELLPRLEQVLSFIRSHIESFYREMRLEREKYLANFENLLNDAVLSNISEGIIITDKSFSVMHINSVASIMLGFPNRQVIGHPLSDLLVTSEGLQSLTGADRSDRDVKYLHRRSGELFPCRIKSREVEYDGNGYRIFILSDETESEDSRLKSEQLTQRAFLGDFASLMAHEIRNPINNMRIWLANIEKSAQDSEGIISAVHRIDDDCLRISELVSNILSFSKPVAVNKEEVDLAMLISDVIEKWKLNFVRKNITCYFTPPEGLPKILGDPRSLEQVLVNLISNSVDALGESGGVITLRLSLKDQLGGRRTILITESDNGSGIPSEKIDHIFEPFMTTKKNGNGWGLAISKKIITSHKGTIHVESFSGGTVFQIQLPLPDDRG